MSDEKNKDKQREIDEFLSQFDENDEDAPDKKDADDIDKTENEKEIDEFLSQFDEIADDLNNPGDGHDAEDGDRHDESTEDLSTSEPSDSPDEEHRMTRSERLRDQKNRQRENNRLISLFAGISERFSHTGSDMQDADDEVEGNGNDPDLINAPGCQDTKNNMSRHIKKSNKKYKLNGKQLAKTLACLFLALVFIMIIYSAIIIVRLPSISPDNIYSMLSESSVLYDDDGNIISAVGNGETRTNVEYNQLPENLVNAVIAIEDKTFMTHKGFNIIRMFGAVKDAVFSRSGVHGTSTITQQLARNVYLPDTKAERSLKRKISEAYYTVIIEKELSKELIIEAYLNTIGFGFGSYGVQTASQSYFSKDVSDLDLIECAALAALPKAPGDYALIKRFEPEQVDPVHDIVIHYGNDYTYVYNGDASKGRRQQVLVNMCDQGFITEEEKDAALEEDLLDHINPDVRSINEISSYFSDYVIEAVINDYAEINNTDYETAKEKVYNGGLQIYTTMDSDMQSIVDKEFSNNANFPHVYGIKKDPAGNVLSNNGKVLMYAYSNYFDNEGNFTLRPDEYEWLDNGDLKLLAGKRLKFYQTQVQDQTDISIEFKNLYSVEDNVFYSIQGGAILIPQQFKTRDKDKNAIISKEFFDGDEYASYIKEGKNGDLIIDKDHYTLRQKVVQPQSSIVITDFKTGHIKALAGGRNTVGARLFNRAVNPRQPGSSIKPIAVYGPALQQSCDMVEKGSSPKFSGEDQSLYGQYFTAASVIDDTPLIFDGKQWPKNWYPGFKGLQTMRESIKQSINVNSVKVLQQVGIDYSKKFIKSLGITSLVESGAANDMNAAALALGGMTNGISPLEMASAYGSFINEGTYVEPVPYTHVTNKQGEIILEKEPYKKKVMDPGVAFIMTDMLRSVVTESFGSGAAIPNQPVAGKTGTTNDNFDAWFVGFTPQYTAAVWIGNDVNIELSNGSDAATRVWGRIMKQVCAGIPTGSFPSRPSNVVSQEIDTKSGCLPSELSAIDDRGTIRSEYFIKGTVPVMTDNIHKSLPACSETNYLATPACPGVYQRFGVMRPYIPNPSVGDINYELPHYYCPIHNPDPSKYPVDPNFNGVGIDPGIKDPTIVEPDPGIEDNGSGNGDNGTSEGDLDPHDHGTDAPPDWI